MNFDEWITHSGVCVHVKGKVAKFSSEFPLNPLDSCQSFLSRHNIAKKNFQNCLYQLKNVSDDLFLLIKSSEECSGSKAGDFSFFSQDSPERWRLYFKVSTLALGQISHKSLSNSCITHPVPRMSIVIYCLIQNSVQSQLKSGGWHQEVQPLRLFRQDLWKDRLTATNLLFPFFHYFLFWSVSVFVSPIPPPGFLMSTMTPKSAKQSMSKFLLSHERGDRLAGSAHRKRWGGWGIFSFCWSWLELNLAWGRPKVSTCSVYPGHLHFLPKWRNSLQLLSLISILLPSARSQRLHHPISVSYTLPQLLGEFKVHFSILSLRPDPPSLWAGISPQHFRAPNSTRRLSWVGETEQQKTGRLWWCPWKKPSTFSKNSQDKYAEGFFFFLP